MIIKTTTLQGSRLEENQPPNVLGNELLCFRNKDKAFALSYEQISKHLLEVGGTGSGKTNVFLQIISQIKSKMGPNDIMLVFDSKLDFRGFHSENDFLISNADSQAVQKVGWNIFGDVVSDGWTKSMICLNADEIADVIFKDYIEESSQPFFPTAARDIFSAIVKAMAFTALEDKEFRYKFLNNEYLSKYLQNVDAKKLGEYLKKFPELCGVLKYVGNGASDQALGVFAELQSVTSKLFVKCFGTKGKFSVRLAERMRGASTIFVEYDASCGLSLQPIYRVLLDLFLKEAMSPQRKGGHIYVVCDELKLVPKLKYLEDALNFGRSIGISVVAGIQSMEQLYEVYGEYGGRNIASGFQNVFCFRTNNAASREYIKGLYGANYVSTQILHNSQAVSEECRIGNTVEDWDINSLGVGEAIVGITGEKPFKFMFERFRR